jgi:hypothetical protein
LTSVENNELRKWIVESKCKCSFECALTANVAWNVAAYPKLLISTLKNIGRKQPSSPSPRSTSA